MIMLCQITLKQLFYCFVVCQCESHASILEILMSYKITLLEEYFFCIVGLLKSVRTNQLRRISMAQSNNIIDTC